MNIVGLIPARSGSKGILNKNMVALCGKPLIKYTFDAAKASTYLDRIILSTDDESIAVFGRENGIEVPFLRPKNLAEDNSSMIDVALHLLNFLQKKENKIPDYIMILQPTSPLRSKNHIDEACQIIFLKKDIDTIVSVCQIPHNYNPESIYSLEEGKLINYVDSPSMIYNRHRKSIFYARNGPAILLSKTKVILQNNSFYGKNILPYIMDHNVSYDIDEPLDIKIVNMILIDKLRQSE